MNKILATVAVLSLCTLGQARDPIFIPQDQALAFQVPQQYAPSPTPMPAPMAAPQPIPQPHYATPYASPMPAGPIYEGDPCIVCDNYAGCPLPLFPHVKVRQARNIHPCAVEKIVAVPNPCGPGCVHICICVPPCACECVKVGPLGRRTCFDYGKYSVTVIERRHGLVVDYND